MCRERHADRDRQKSVQINIDRQGGVTERGMQTETEAEIKINQGKHRQTGRGDREKGMQTKYRQIKITSDNFTTRLTTLQHSKIPQTQHSRSL